MYYTLYIIYIVNERYLLHSPLLYISSLNIFELMFDSQDLPSAGKGSVKSRDMVGWYCMRPRTGSSYKVRLLLSLEDDMLQTCQNTWRKRQHQWNQHESTMGSTYFLTPLHTATYLAHRANDWYEAQISGTVKLVSCRNLALQDPRS